YAKSGELEQELAYWVAEADSPVSPLPVDNAGGDNFEASVRTVTVALSASETEALLRKVPAAYRTQINDVLLTALVQAVGGWTGTHRVLVELEGHGREDLFPGVDLSRT